MAEVLGGAGNVIIVRGANGSQAGDDRAEGFKAGIEGTGLELINEQPGDWVVDKAMQVTENMIQANPDIQGIFCCSDNMLPGILQALNNNDIEGVTIISFDGSDAGIGHDQGWQRLRHRRPVPGQDRRLGRRVPDEGHQRRDRRR